MGYVGWLRGRLLLVHLLGRLWLALVASPRNAVTRLAPRLRGAGVGGSIGAGCVAPQWVVGWGGWDRGVGQGGGMGWVGWGGGVI